MFRLTTIRGAWQPEAVPAVPLTLIVNRMRASDTRSWLWNRYCWDLHSDLACPRVIAGPPEANGAIGDDFNQSGFFNQMVSWKPRRFRMKRFLSSSGIESIRLRFYPIDGLDEDSTHVRGGIS